MDIILLERVPSLGQMGDVVSVRPGYARNFLLPQKKALRATKANREYFDRQKAQLVALNLERRAEAEKVAKKVDGLSVVVTRQAGETGVLYGSVSARDIAEAVVAKKLQIERRQVSIDAPIKMLGLFPVTVHLHPEVAVKITVNVARTEEEAVIQAERGTAFIATPGASEGPASISEPAALVGVGGAEGASAEKPAKKAKKSSKEKAEAE